jgi:hypothetical protein
MPITPAELQAIDSRVYQHFQNHPKGRLLIHSLDTTLLSDQEYGQIYEHQLTEEQLREAPWAMALFWGRLFYEESDGNNYRRIIQDRRVTKPDSLFDRIHTTCSWFPPDDLLADRRTYRFQAECWLTSNEGRTSKLWKSLRRFVRKAVQGATNQQICGFNPSDEEDITPPIQWLLENQDADFCNSLRWLYGGANGQAIPGNGVEGVIKTNPIYPQLQKLDDFTASFGLRVSATRSELVLRIRNIAFGSHDPGNSRELRIKQNDQILFQGVVSRQSPKIVLGDSAFPQNPDFSNPINICLGNMELDSSDVAPIQWNESELLLFRQSDEGDVSRLVFKDPNKPLEIPHVQGRYFYLLGRPGVPTPLVLELEGVRQNLICCGAVTHALITRQLYRLDLGGLHNDLAPLIEQGALQPLAMIGKKPFLSIDPPPCNWHLHGGDETPVIIGSQQVTISARNFVGNQIQISVTDELGNIRPCIPHSNDPMKFDLTIGQAHWGKKWKIRAASQISRDQAIVEYLFLPDLSSQGVHWVLSNIPDVVRFGHARTHGLEDGVLYYPGGPTQLLRPIEVPTWAWSQPMGFYQDFNQNKQFADHQDISTWSIDYVLPPGGNWELRFNNCLVSRESGRASLSDLVANHIPLGQMGANLGVMDELQIIDTANGAPLVPAVAQIDRNPVHPVVGMVHGIPSLYIPTAFHQAGWRLFLHKESHLLNNSIQEIPLQNYPPGNIHQINGLPGFHPDEGAWLVLLDFGVFGNIGIPGLMELAGVLNLPQVAISSICELAPEGVGQTFLRLLDIWQRHPLNAQEHEQIRSRLDLLERCIGQKNMPQGQGELFARARRDRHHLGYGSRAVLNQYFDSEFLRAVDNGQEAIEKLLHLLLECGFNWLAEPQWIESLPGTMRGRIRDQNRRFTEALKERLKGAVPLIESFESIQGGKCEGIKRISPEFLNPPVNQGEIGLSVACPASEDPSFRNGIAYRGVVNNGINLTGFQNRPRKVFWPNNYRHAVEIMDTRGQVHPIILKVTDASRAAAFMEDEREDQIVAASNLQETRCNKIRIRRLFHRVLRSATLLTGNTRISQDGDTQLGLLFRACNVHFMRVSREKGDHGFRSVIHQAAVMSRLHAWVTEGNFAPVGWPLNDPASYDLLARVMATIWNSPEHRKALEKDIAPIEWLITWFKNPDFYP